MWQYILGGAAMGGGILAGMHGASQARDAQAGVLRAETRRQAGLDRELGAKTDALLAEQAPLATIATEQADTAAGGAELNQLSSDVQAGAQAVGLPGLTAGTAGRIQTAARRLARLRAQRRGGDRARLALEQYLTDRSRIAQRSRTSQGIAGVEAQDAAGVGQGWRDLGQGLTGLSSLALLAPSGGGAGAAGASTYGGG